MNAIAFASWFQVGVRTDIQLGIAIQSPAFARGTAAALHGSAHSFVSRFQMRNPPAQGSGDQGMIPAARPFSLTSRSTVAAIRVRRSIVASMARESIHG